jgi:hypothetical protein
VIEASRKRRDRGACQSEKNLTEYTEGAMRRVTVSLDVPDEDHEDVVDMLERCANRIAYNHPKIGTIRWLDDTVVRPQIVPMHPDMSGSQERDTPLV